MEKFFNSKPKNENPTLFELPVTINNYEFIEILGQGGFSTVYKVFDLNYRQFFAAKVQITNCCDVSVGKCDVKSEIAALMKLDHPNIIRLYNHFMKDNLLFLILEFCPYGSLEDYIKKSAGGTKFASSVFLPKDNQPNDDTQFSQFAGIQIKRDEAEMKELRSLTRQIVSAVGACHAKNIAHRDIKLSNILIDNNLRPKLADFGICVNMNKEQTLNQFNGSLLYLAPEIFMKVPYDPFKADIWSLGILIYFLVMKRSPWASNDMRVILQAIKAENYPPLPVEYKQYSEVIKKMIINNPSKRATINEILECDLFKEDPEEKFSKQQTPFANKDFLRPTSFPKLPSVVNYQPKCCSVHTRSAKLKTTGKTIIESDIRCRRLSADMRKKIIG